MANNREPFVGGSYDDQGEGEDLGAELLAGELDFIGEVAGDPLAAAIAND